MYDFIQKMTDLLKTRFPGCDLELEDVGANRAGGLLIWSAFTGKEQIERQREVWSFVRQNLEVTDQRRIASLLTLTPKEVAWARDT